MTGNDRHNAGRVHSWLGLIGIAGGLMWMFKAITIMLGHPQPPLLFEAGPVLLGLSILGLIGRMASNTSVIARVAVIITYVALTSRIAASVYEQVPGAVTSNNETFVFPYSLLVLVGSPLGFYITLLLLGTLIVKSGTLRPPWSWVPSVVALSLIPFGLTAAINVELPIVLLGLSWCVLGYVVWRWNSLTPDRRAVTLAPA